MAMMWWRRAPHVGLILFGSWVIAACGTPIPQSAPGSSVGGTVIGQVTAGPTCPVERFAQPCPPHPVTADVQARVQGRVVASRRSDADGTFRLQLPSGTYTLVATTDSVLPRCDPLTVFVTEAQTTSADITCDTGVR
jgi:hypothetical protein